MSKRSYHGSTFESWLDEAGIREEVTAAAIQSVLAAQIESEMKKQGMSKTHLAKTMKTSRAQIDRFLDPDSGSVTLETLMRAAHAVGKTLRLEIA